MGDLDDFFAKKDKRKGKKVAQTFSSTEEMAKRLEENAKKEEIALELAKNEAAKAEALQKKLLQDDQQRDEEKAREEALALETVPENADQWNDFKDDVAVDVSDLKIGNLNTQEDENNGSDCDDDDDSTNGEKTDKSVWHNTQEERPTICDAVDEALESGKAVTAEVAQAAVASTAKWIPRGMGGDMAASPLPRGAGAGSGAGRRKKNAPDLGNEESFPTLGSKPKKNKAPKAKQEPASNVYQPKRVAPRSVGGASDGMYQPPSSRVGTSNRFGGLSDQSNQGGRW